jgi:hypothetical protein
MGCLFKAAYFFCTIFVIIVLLIVLHSKYIIVKNEDMIKLKLLLIIGLIPFSLFSQGSAKVPVDAKTGLIAYQEVVPENGSQDELYIRAIEWINANYKNPADVSRVRNRESGVIELLHRFEIFDEKDGTKVLAGTVNYTLSLEFKPGRYRYTISELTLRQASRFPAEKWLDKSDPAYKPEWDSYLQQVDAQTKELIASLKEGMHPEKVQPEDKW